MMTRLKFGRHALRILIRRLKSSVTVFSAAAAIFVQPAHPHVLINIRKPTQSGLNALICVLRIPPVKDTWKKPLKPPGPNNPDAPDTPHHVIVRGIERS
jgi:hypothetical protein